jgi:hypothetical protein
VLLDRVSENDTKFGQVTRYLDIETLRWNPLENSLALADARTLLAGSSESVGIEHFIQSS